jgi:ABC-type molybdate transport system substrate-binding protein
LGHRSPRGPPTSFRSSPRARCSRSRRRPPPDSSATTGHRLRFVFGTVGALRNRIVAGEAADVAMLSAAALAELERGGFTAPGTRSVIGTVGSGIAVRAGAPVPRIATPEDLREALLAARSISYGDPGRGATAGIHFTGVLERLGIAEQLARAHGAGCRSASRRSSASPRASPSSQSARRARSSPIPA